MSGHIRHGGRRRKKKKQLTSLAAAHVAVTTGTSIAFEIKSHAPFSHTVEEVIEAAIRRLMEA